MCPATMLAKSRTARLKGRTMKSRQIMVIGACGAIGRSLVRACCDEGVDILGVDRRRWRGIVPDGLQLQRIGLNKRPFEDLFRIYRPELVIHVGLVSSPRIDMDERYEHNVVGMQRVVRCALLRASAGLIMRTVHPILLSTPG